MNTYGNSSPKAESLSTGSFDAKGYIEDEFFKGVEPDSYMPVSEWADKYRVLSSKSASEPGRWRTDRTPYLKEIMDCLSPKSPIQKVVFMKGAQIGGTECGNNWLGYVMHKAPGPIMAVSPTVEMAKRNSKQRIDPLIEDCPELKKTGGSGTFPGQRQHYVVQRFSGRRIGDDWSKLGGGAAFHAGAVSVYG